MQKLVSEKLPCHTAAGYESLYLNSLPPLGGGAMQYGGRIVWRLINKLPRSRAFNYVLCVYALWLVCLFFFHRVLFIFVPGGWVRFVRVFLVNYSKDVFRDYGC